jgi:hypothetical protein
MIEDMCIVGLSVFSFLEKSRFLTPALTLYVKASDVRCSRKTQDPPLKLALNALQSGEDK